MQKRTASCSCGALSAVCSGEPVSVSLCNCLECQKRTGSMFGIAAFFYKKDVSIVGTPVRYSRPSDTGFDVRFSFCPACASTVFWMPSRKPQLIAVAVGAFSDPEFPAPNKAVFDRRRPAWVEYAIKDRTA